MRRFQDYNLQTFLLFGFARFSLQNPLFPEQIRIAADMLPFGCYRMTTDKGGFMELRVWFRHPFSVRDVHWQKWAEKGRAGWEKGCDQRGFVPWVRLNLSSTKEIAAVYNLLRIIAWPCSSTAESCPHGYTLPCLWKWLQRASLRSLSSPFQWDAGSGCPWCLSFKLK